MQKDIEKYTYRIEWSEEDHVHVARCLEFPSLSAHGDTIDKALKEIKFVVAETIKWLEETNEPIPEPLGVKKFKGHLTLRTSPEKHRELAIRSLEQGISINQFILSKL